MYMYYCCWLPCDCQYQEVKALLFLTSTSQVSHTHTGGLAQDKTKSFHPEKAHRQAPKGTASFTLHTAQSIVWSLSGQPVAESLCLVWHLVVEISNSASWKSTFPSVFRASKCDSASVFYCITTPFIKDPNTIWLIKYQIKLINVMLLYNHM